MDQLDKMDAKEEKRVREKRKQALKRPHLKLAVKGGPGQNAHVSKARRAQACFSLHLNTRTLGLTREGIGEFIRRKIQARANWEPPPCVEHVKDGKPLTAIGAKLLGVPWPATKAPDGKPENNHEENP